MMESPSMNLMANEPRWDDLVKPLEALAQLDDSLLRRRYSEPPPSSPSGASTVYEGIDRPEHNQEQIRESLELNNSKVGQQFNLQCLDEQRRIVLAENKGLIKLPGRFDCVAAARANVKYRWIEQGIWNENWEDRVADQLWKHEDPLEIGLDSGDITELNLEDYCSKPRPNKRRRLDDNVEDQRQNTAKWRILKARQREASRPIYQFVYQVCKEQEWLLVGLSSEEISDETNIDAVAHEIVRRRWIEQGLWDSAWLYIPGTSWRHEQPRKFPLKDQQLDEQQAAEKSLDPSASPPSYRIIPHNGYPSKHSVYIPPLSESNIFGNHGSNQRTWTSEINGDEPLVSPYNRARQDIGQHDIAFATKASGTKWRRKPGGKARSLPGEDAVAGAVQTSENPKICMDGKGLYHHPSIPRNSDNHSIPVVRTGSSGPSGKCLGPMLNPTSPNSKTLRRSPRTRELTRERELGLSPRPERKIGHRRQETPSTEVGSLKAKPKAKSALNAQTAASTKGKAGGTRKSTRKIPRK